MCFQAARSYKLLSHLQACDNLQVTPEVEEKEMCDVSESGSSDSSSDDEQEVVASIDALSRRNFVLPPLPIEYEAVICLTSVSLHVGLKSKPGRVLCGKMRTSNFKVVEDAAPKPWPSDVSHAALTRS